MCSEVGLASSLAGEEGWESLRESILSTSGEPQVLPPLQPSNGRNQAHIKGSIGRGEGLLQGGKGAKL